MNIRCRQQRQRTTKRPSNKYKLNEGNDNKNNYKKKEEILN